MGAFWPFPLKLSSSRAYAVIKQPSVVVNAGNVTVYVPVPAKRYKVSVVRNPAGVLMVRPDVVDPQASLRVQSSL